MRWLLAVLAISGASALRKTDGSAAVARIASRARPQPTEKTSRFTPGKGSLLAHDSRDRAHAQEHPAAGLGRVAWHKVKAAGLSTGSSTRSPLRILWRERRFARRAQAT